MPHNTSSMPVPLTGSLERFEVSKNAFLPEQLPLDRLSDPYYESWETILDQLPSLLATASLRGEVDRLQVLDISRLVSQREWQRAYLILSFFTHSYIWESGGPSERLPASISVPFLAVSSHLGLPPTATYAALNLWNFTRISPSASLSNVDNLRALHTFTGTRDEEWFYVISVAIESHGAPIIPAMLSAMDAAQADKPDTVIEALGKFSQCIREIGMILQRMDDHCQPDVFYNKIRPFLAGSKNMAVAGLPNGVFYDEGEGKGQWRQYSGGSNAQSSLIQFLDVALGVEHSLTGAKKGSNPGFLNEMRNYMPGPHRAFLQHVESVSNIRNYAATNTEVAIAYNAAVEELSHFRDIHIQIVTRYIINPSRKQGPVKNAGMNLAVASTHSKTKSLHGTGGTALIPFLKQSRDETKATSLQ
ncbi:Indoleamine 2,3-dioxygenase [Pleomassaria siparia CBS 279.74]|uniref:Indoleamine 2,3-dioxygenase n=1 Tax=Pleomassaria siparia CBS 279.74 TaxID=1314801 RepID=A0A6G1K8Z7_9PLEO|nr:Indoleamine 2,3-dioxygenase [Pleomassaria siparia CBS 279.74]